jgi:hypothetical protein
MLNKISRKIEELMKKNKIFAGVVFLLIGVFVIYIYFAYTFLLQS